MNFEENVVFSALARGRLIFPFRDEMSALRSNQRPLIEDESARLTALSDAFEKIKIKDQWFHSAMQGGDWETAEKASKEAQAILEDLA